MTPFHEADARLAAMHGYEPVRGDDEIPADLLEAILALSEWEPPPLVAQGRATGIAVRGEFPPLTWDF